MQKRAALIRTAPGSQPSPAAALPARAANFKPCAGVGVVEENGPGAHKFQRGQRVISILWPARSNPKLDRSKAAGTFQQYLAVPEDLLVILQ